MMIVDLDDDDAVDLPIMMTMATKAEPVAATAFAVSCR